jgi:hypothetical protein
MYLALLISPSWLIVWTTLIRGFELVYDPSSTELALDIKDSQVEKEAGPTLPFFIVELSDIFSGCFRCCFRKHDFGNHELISALSRGMGTE